MGFTDWLKDLLGAPSHQLSREELRQKAPSIKAPPHVGPNTPADEWVKTGLEKAMQGLNWAYDNGVSQPISTYLLATTNKETSVSDLLHASTWSKAWKVAEHVSPGQAFWANQDEVAKIMEAQPLYLRPGDAMLPPGFDKLSEDEQQDILRKSGMPAIGNRAVERIKRDVSFFNFASGATDFAARWWLDPTILGGKAIGGAKAKYVTKPRPSGGWSKQGIADLMKSSTMAQAQRFLWENRENPQTINNLDMFRKSALGPRAGGIINQLKSEDEVRDFLLVTLGDVEARARLSSGNAAAKLRLEQDTARIPALDLALSRTAAHGNTRAQAMVQERMDELNAGINADEDLVGRYTAMLDHQGELDALNLTRFSFGRAERRTAAQNEYRARSALGVGPEGLSKTRLFGDYFGIGITMVRAFKEMHPNGHIRIGDIDRDSVNELRGHIARIPGIGPEIRQDLLNRYLKTTTEGERLDLLDEVGRLGVGQVAKKHGFTDKEGLELYKQYQIRMGTEKENLRRYSAATQPGTSLHVDEWMDSGGGLALHPNMVTRLANDHVQIDLQALDRTLARHGSDIKALRTRGGTARDMFEDSLDYFNHVWKFGALFRLGYMPRVLGDDVGGQIARLGAATMALRTGYGVKNLATNLAHWKPASHYELREATALEGVKYADEELALLRPKAEGLRFKVEARTTSDKADLTRARDRLRRAQNKLNAMGPETPAVTVSAMQKSIAKHEEVVKLAERRLTSGSPGKTARLSELDEQLSHLNAAREESLAAAKEARQARKRGFQQSSQLQREVALPGAMLPAAFGGQRGEYYQKLISSDDSLANLFQSNKKMIHGNLMRSFSHSGVSVSAAQDEALHLKSWSHAINAQIMQDQLGALAVKGATVPEMSKWLSTTAAGRAYRKRLGLKWVSNEDVANSVYYDVAHYMPVATKSNPGTAIREAALKGELDERFLASAVPIAERPEVHTTQLGENTAAGAHFRGAMDRVIDRWFRTVATLPADRMSRHPLFNQLYEGHARNLAAQELKQGAKITQADADRLTEAARRLALKDTRKLVFDIAHRSDAAHALRFISPFFAATTEGWQRWARIIADRPQVVGYAGNFFNNMGPALGKTVDMNGDTVLPDGTSIDPATGLKRLVPKGERRILVRMPKFVADGPIGKALGMDSSGNWSLSQDSMFLVTQGDPWFNTGTGPMVQIPVNEWVKDKPKQADLAQALGILPFGAEAGGTALGEGVLGRAAQFALPGTIKNFLTAFDTSDERYQRTKLFITQKAAFEHANLGKPMPSAKEIADMTRNYWLFSATSAFLQPFATAKPDKYQFYRDQYNALRRKNPLKADEDFLNRFGESYFIFAQATSKSSGVQPTQRAVELSKQYGDLIAKNPELASLIVGPDGDGPFSQGAYVYQLNTPLVPGGAEMQRTKMSAEEAMKENQRRLGWAKYTKQMNRITAELHKRGLNSFDDEGAEDLKDEKKAYTSLYAEPLYPDGTENPYYNAEWSRDFYSFDARKYERMIPGLTAIARSPLAQQPGRSDLRLLQEYLGGRQALLRELADRGAVGEAKTLTAQANADLQSAWVRFVDDLVERDTRFGDLYHRYLSRDMGVDLEDMAQEEVG